MLSALIIFIGLFIIFDVIAWLFISFATAAGTLIGIIGTPIALFILWAIRLPFKLLRPSKNLSVH